MPLSGTVKLKFLPEAQILKISKGYKKVLAFKGPRKIKR